MKVVRTSKIPNETQIWLGLFVGVSWWEFVDRVSRSV